MLGAFSSIILDVVVIVLLLAIIAIGALKGVFHTSINLLLLAGSVALTFSPLLNVVKKPLIDMLAEKITLGAGTAQEAKLGVELSLRFIVSLALAVLLYVLLRLIKLVIILIVKKRAKKNNKLLKTPRVLSRISGALISLLFHGALLVVSLSVFVNPLIGGDKTAENTVVAQYVAKTDDLILDAVIDNPELLKNQVLVKLIKGDLYVKVSDDAANSMKNVSKMVGHGKILGHNLEEAQATADALTDMLVLIDELALDDKGNVKDYEGAVEMAKDLTTKAVNEMKALFDSSGRDPDDLLEIDGAVKLDNLIKDKYKLTDVAQTFESIVKLAS